MKAKAIDCRIGHNALRAELSLELFQVNVLPIAATNLDLI